MMMCVVEFAFSEMTTDGYWLILNHHFAFFSGGEHFFSE
jgi:hypothetical protein